MGAKKFSELFLNKYGRKPETGAAAGAIAGVTFQKALEQAGTLDKEIVKETIRTLDFVSLFGQIKFDETGRIIERNILSLQIQNGTKVIVAPDEVKTGEVIYPAPRWDER